MCLGPSAVAVMKGRLMEVWGREDSSILVFSAASVRLRGGRQGGGESEGVGWRVCATAAVCVVDREHVFRQLP